MPVAQLDRAPVSEAGFVSGSNPLRHEFVRIIMLKIRRTLFDHIKEKDFDKFMFVNPEKIHKLSGNMFLRIINHILPPTKKFLRESFNAKDNGKIIAQISLVPDNFSNFRWQISSLKIRQENEFIAKPLIDFVVNKYGGSGVSSFLIYIDEKYP